MSSIPSHALLLPNSGSTNSSMEQFIANVLEGIDECQETKHSSSQTQVSKSIYMDVDHSTNQHIIDNKLSLSMSTTDPAISPQISLVAEQQHIETHQHIQITKIRPSNKDIVFGFVRSLQMLLTSTENGYLPILMSPSIYNICLFYYSNIEYFTKIAPNMSTFDECHIIHSYYAAGTAYGNVQINNTDCIKYIWSFNICTMDQSIIAIGIDSSNKEYIDTAFHDCNNPNIYYGVEILAMSGYSFKYSMNNEQEKYGNIIEDGDEITMELDVKRKTLRYYINGIDQGIAFDNIEFKDDTTYFMAVYLWKVVKIELTRFYQIYVE